MAKLYKPEQYILKADRLDAIQRRKWDIEEIRKFISTLQEKQLVEYLAWYVYRERVERIEQITVTEDEFNSHFRIRKSR